MPTDDTPIASDSMLSAELDAGCVDGFVISPRWSDVQPTVDGGYDWSSLDSQLVLLAAHGKNAVVELGPGMVVPSGGSPGWLCESPDAGGAGVSCLALVGVVFPGATQSPCEAVLLPLPWDNVFQQQFGQAITAFAAHVAAGRLDAGWPVVEIHVTGINDSDWETALPFTKGSDGECSSGSACQMDAGPSAAQPGWCQQTDAVGALLDAGYGYSNMQSAFEIFANDLRAGSEAGGVALTLGSQVSPSLPSPGAPEMKRELVDGFIDGGLGPITAQDNGLTATAGPALGVLDALNAGLPVGYQEAVPVARDGIKCTMSRGLTVGADWDGGCTSEQVMDLTIENALDAGASFIEIYKYDVQAYPNACTLAHQALVH